MTTTLKQKNEEAPTLKGVQGQKSSFRLPDDEFVSHPGGQTMLDLGRQKEREKKNDHAEILFLTSHMGMDLDGRIAKEARARGMTLPERGPLYNELHEMVRRVKQEHPEAELFYQAWCLFITVLLPTSAGIFIATGGLECVVVFGLSVISYVFNIFHMRHHRGEKVFGIRWLDRWTAPVYDFLDNTIAICPRVWVQNHQASHHLATNHAYDDYDIQSPFKVGLRQSPDLPWNPNCHPYQQYYAPLLFAMNVFTFPFENYFLYGGSLIHFSAFWMLLLLPLYFHGWSAVGRALICFLSLSMTVSYLFEISHNHLDLGNGRKALLSLQGGGLNKKNPSTNTCDNGKARGRNNIVDMFIATQVRESLSWGGFWACLFLGGINYQVEHHVVPCLPPMYYHFIAPHLRAIVEQHGMDYVREKNFWDAVVTYHTYLSVMGQKPNM